MRYLPVVATAVMATSCVHQPPGSHQPIFSYAMPRSDVFASIALTLEACDRGQLIVTGDMVTMAIAGADRVVELTSADLTSARVKRQLDIALHDTGTIASLNSVAEDRSAAIIGNALTFAGTIARAAMGFAESASKHRCTTEVQSALRRVATIDTLIPALRQAPQPVDARAYRDRLATLDRLLAERASLRSGVLRLDMMLPLDLAAARGPGKPAHNVSITLGQFTPWLDGVAKSTTTALELSWRTDRAAPPVDAYANCDAAFPYICLASPVEVALTYSLISETGAAIALLGAVSGSDRVPVPQWGTPTLLPLDVGFGGARNIALTIDKFGRRTALKWASAAQAETITAGLAGIATPAAGLAAALAPKTETEIQTTEIQALQTRQQLNRLRACKEILSRGGSACPAEATPEP